MQKKVFDTSTVFIRDVTQRYRNPLEGISFKYASNLELSNPGCDVKIKQVCSTRMYSTSW